MSHAARTRENETALRVGIDGETNRFSISLRAEHCTPPTKVNLSIIYGSKNSCAPSGLGVGACLVRALSAVTARRSSATNRTTGGQPIGSVGEPCQFGSDDAAFEEGNAGDDDTEPHGGRESDGFVEKEPPRERGDDRDDVRDQIRADGADPADEREVDGIRRGRRGDGNGEDREDDRRRGRRARRALADSEAPHVKQEGAERHRPRGQRDALDGRVDAAHEDTPEGDDRRRGEDVQLADGRSGRDRLGRGLDDDDDTDETQADTDDAPDIEALAEQQEGEGGREDGIQSVHHRRGRGRDRLLAEKEEAVVGGDDGRGADDEPGRVGAGPRNPVVVTPRRVREEDGRGHVEAKRGEKNRRKRVEAGLDRDEGTTEKHPEENEQTGIAVPMEGHTRRFSTVADGCVDSAADRCLTPRPLCRHT